MISSETPYKLAEIIRDTWPNLYRPAKVSYNEKNIQTNERVLDCNRK
jgi:hypothetical protein